MICASGRLVARRFDAIQWLHFLAEERGHIRLLDEIYDVLGSIRQSDIHVGMRRVSDYGWILVLMNRSLELPGPNSGSRRIPGH